MRDHAYALEAPANMRRSARFPTGHGERDRPRPRRPEPAWIETPRTSLRVWEENLRQSEERFRGYFQSGLIGAAITLPDKSIIEVNDKLCEVLGYAREELLHLDWASLTHPDDLAADVAMFDRVLSGERDSYVLDKRFIRKCGATAYCTISVSAVRRADRSVDYIVAVIQDVSERKLAQEMLHTALTATVEAIAATIETRDACVRLFREKGFTFQKGAF